MSREMIEIRLNMAETQRNRKKSMEKCMPIRLKHKKAKSQSFQSLKEQAKVAYELKKTNETSIKQDLDIEQFHLNQKQLKATKPNPSGRGFFLRIYSQMPSSKHSKQRIITVIVLQMIYNYHLLFKYILVGDANVGKSSLLLKFIDNKFTDNYESTLGVEFGSKIFNSGSTIVKAMIWDTAGQESFKSIIRSYYKNSIVALLVFDVTSLQSFENVQKWLQEIKINANEHIRIILVGNKSDLMEKRTVKRQIAQELANNLNIPYYETSAKTGSYVGEIFMQPARQLIRDIQTKKLVITNANQTIGIKLGNPELQNKEKAAIQISINSKQKEKCSC